MNTVKRTVLIIVTVLLVLAVSLGLVKTDGMRIFCSVVFVVEHLLILIMGVRRYNSSNTKQYELDIVNIALTKTNYELSRDKVALNLRIDQLEAELAGREGKPERVVTSRYPRRS